MPSVIALAKHAGGEIMAIYSREDFGATQKADDSPLTLADLASHKAILKGLNELTPNIPVLSEEAADIPYATRSQWSLFWLVDPLDGTKEFIKRNGEFTVNIALVEDGVPILGVVYAPVLDTCYYGAQGAGAFKVSRSGFNPTSQGGMLAGEPITVATLTTGQPIKIVASRSHSDERTTALLSKLGDHECISMGSSLKLCLVAEGKAHFYPRLGPTMEWDTAAAHAVVNAAGGIVHDKEGNELHYNKPDLHNPEFFVHDNGDGKLNQLIKEFQ